jgi:hypothetical protein
MEDYRLSAVERAFALAASGDFQNVKELRRALKAEGYLEEGQLRGASITQQIKKLILVATGKTKPISDPLAARAALAQRRARSKSLQD